MSTIVTINAGDQITNSRTDINTNFSNLNTDKVETSVLDTDTSLAANSDAKIPTQKAVKAYVDAGGNVNASETNKGIVEEATDAEVTAGTATGATGAKLFVTPTKLAASKYSPSKTVTSGATITGATLPVPVYQNKTDNEFYACDGNDTAAMKFLGFATSNGTDGASMTVQFNGVVSGFSALDEGEKYYLSDTVGTISTTIGTYEVLVGVAISPTELLIQKGKRRTAGSSLLVASTSGSSVVTCGFRPSRVSLQAYAPTSTGGAGLSWMSGNWVNGVMTGGNAWVDDAPSSETSTNPRLQSDLSSSNYFTFSIDSVTDTGFTLTWTETGNAPKGVVIWNAEGEF